MSNGDKIYPSVTVVFKEVNESMPPFDTEVYVLNDGIVDIATLKRINCNGYGWEYDREIEHDIFEYWAPIKQYKSEA